MDIYGFQIIGELESYKKPFTFEILLPILSRVNFEQNIPSYFLLHWYFDEKSCCVGLFHEWNEWMNPQFKFWIKTSVINVIYSNAEMEKKPRHDKTPTSFPHNMKNYNYYFASIFSFSDSMRLHQAQWSFH